MIIDTNVYSALDKGKESARLALQKEDTIQLPVMVVGELRYGFAFGTREEKNNKRLNLFLAQERVEVLTPSTETAKVYAEFACLCRKRGRALSNNDLWIAALAKQYSQRLVTYDADFKVLQDTLRDKLTLLNE